LIDRVTTEVEMKIEVDKGRRKKEIMDGRWGKKANKIPKIIIF